MCVCVCVRARARARTYICVCKKKLLDRLCTDCEEEKAVKQSGRTSAE